MVTPEMMPHRAMLVHFIHVGFSHLAALLFFHFFSNLNWWMCDNLLTSGGHGFFALYRFRLKLNGFGGGFGGARPKIRFIKVTGVGIV